MKPIFSFETAKNLLAAIEAKEMTLAFEVNDFKSAGEPNSYWQIVEDNPDYKIVTGDSRRLYLVVQYKDWFSSLETLGLWKRPATPKLDQDEQILFDFYWGYSGFDSSGYESTEVNCFITNKARIIDFGTNGDFSKFYGDRGHGISGGTVDSRIELASREEILFSMGITYADKIYSVSGGDVNHFSEEYFLLTQAGFKDTTVPCYGGCQGVYLCTNTETTHTLLDVPQAKCEELNIWDKTYDDWELVSTEYYWFFPGKTRPVKLGSKKTYRLLKKFGGEIPKELESVIPTEGEGWKLYKQ